VKNTVNIKQTIAGLAASAALVAVAAAPSLAAPGDQINYGEVTITAPVVTYTSGVGFASGSGDTFSTQDLLLNGVTAASAGLSSFTLDPGTNMPISVLSTETISSGALLNTGTFTSSGGLGNQPLTGGSFTLTANQSFKLGGTLYSAGTEVIGGTFTNANLIGAAGSSTGNLQTILNNVTWDPGSVYFAQSGLVNPGAFNFDLTGITPPLSIGPSGFGSFKSGGSATQTAASPQISPVPEPCTTASFGLGGFGLLGLLMLRARKARRMTA